MLANRVKKNHRRLHARFERESIGAYRLYDRDIPEVRAVVDWYEGHVVVGEYARTQTDAIEDWLETMAQAVASALGVPEGHLHLKRRRTRPRAGARYELAQGENPRIVVRERDLRFEVNLDDYVDTGLFADHRETRARVRAESEGARVLNLFGYTGAFTCYAAAGGARRTTTVDLSNTYLRWTRANLELNGQWSGAHRLERSDVSEFLTRARRSGRRWDLCVLDPPSYSTRGAEGRALEIQRDHADLIAGALPVLASGGVMYFSTNHQRFRPRLHDLTCAEVKEITADTVPVDFRNRTIHRCWRIVR